jgi:hypothetical protein
MVHGPVWFMDLHGTGRHSPFSGVRRIGLSLDRTKVRHGTVHGPVCDHGPVRDELDRVDIFNTLVSTTYRTVQLQYVRSFPATDVSKLGVLVRVHW